MPNNNEDDLKCSGCKEDCNQLCTIAIRDGNLVTENCPNGHTIDTCHCVNDGK